MASNEHSLLKNWHLKLAILFGIITPTITATGAYYSLQSRISQVESAASEKVDQAQIDTTKNYITKEDFRILQTDVKEMRDNLIEINTLLHKKLR